jgi:hypothetical protein
VATDDATIDFVPAGPRGEGLDAVAFTAADPARVGTTAELCGVRVSFV